MENNKAVWFKGWPVALALVAAAMIICHAIADFKNADRYVSVKGLSEREMEADLVIWPIGFKESSADLATLYDRLSQKNVTITKFLKERGFEESEISIAPANIMDAQAEGYQNPNLQTRFKATSIVTVRTKKVAEVLKARRDINLLVKNGVALFGDEWANKTEFLFTKLNDIKPAMIEEATKNGREAATKFAQDAGSKAGAIRRATQGFFTIEEFDKSSPQLKRIRVVTTIDFFIE